MRALHLARQLTVLAACLLGSLSGCSDDDTGDSGSDSGVSDAQTTDSGAVDAAIENPYDSVAAVTAYFDGKTLVMEGDAIPSHPQGFNEDVNYGAATQCYHRVGVELKPGPAMRVTSDLGTLNGAPNVGNMGTCDRTTRTITLSFETTALLIENVAADGSCFDITATYTGFGQEGRGMISTDGQTLKLEVYIQGQASGHRCADGPPGSTGVTVSGVAFAGDAVQVYTLQE